MDEVTPIASRGPQSKLPRRSRSSIQDRADELWAKATQAYEMRAGGKLPSEIAEELGIEPSEVARLFGERFAFDASFLTDMERKGILGLELIRLEKLIAAVWPSAMMGDPKSVHEAGDLVMKEARLTQLEAADPVVNKNLVLVMGEREDDYIAALRATQND